MAKQKIVWLDSRNYEHSSEAEADRADLRYLIEERLKDICDNGDVDLKISESWGPEWVGPVAAYFYLLLKEAEERSRQRG